jgi:cell division transport system permease protein
MKLSTFGFLTRRGVRNLGKHWAMTIACIASLSVCMTLNTFATLAEVNVDSMVNYLGQQNEMVVFVDPEADDATTASVGERITATPGVSSVQYMSKEDTLNAYRGFLSDYASLLDEFENDNPFKANYRVSLSDLSQMSAISQQFQTIPGVYSVSAPVEMTNTFVEIQKVVTKGGQAIIAVLMIVSIITVGSTIRLSVFARRREIEIMKYVGATNAMVTLPFFMEGLTMGLISGAITSAAGIGGYYYIVEASSTFGGLWQMLMGAALVPVENVWLTILTYSLAGGALVGALGSTFSIRKHLNV